MHQACVTLQAASLSLAGDGTRRLELAVCRTWPTRPMARGPELLCSLYNKQAYVVYTCSEFPLSASPVGREDGLYD
jgi:hypothetical protein